MAARSSRLSWSPPILVQARSKLQLACLIALPLAAAGCSGGGSRSASPRPNLLLITVDSLRADRLGFAGRRDAGTPSLDDLAARGTSFARALTPAPEGPPAVASLMTGQYPATHGLHTSEAEALPQSATTLAELLKDHGYRTAGFAASVLLHPKYGLDQGFDIYGAAFAEAPRPSLIPEMGFAAERVVDQALEFLETARGAPFFLWINFFDPHYFYAPPEPFASRYRDDPYQGEIAYVDREAGRLLRKLEDYGLERSTIVVLAGSHGEGLREHGEEYHGSLLHSATTHVPLIIAAPSMARGGRVDAPVSLVDVAPTLLELLAIDAPRGMEGASLAFRAAAERPIYMEARLPARLFGWTSLTGVVAGSFKYVSGARGELLDLASDPEETRDIAAERADVRDRLAALASAYAARTSAGEAPEGEAREAIRALGYSSDPEPRSVKDPRDMVAAANDALRGHRQLRRRALQAAHFLFEGVRRQDPDNYIGLIDSALLAGAQGQRDEARRLLERARSLYPGAAEVYHQMGHFAEAVEGAGGRQRAGRLWLAAALLDPLNEEALYDAACTYALEGKSDQALDTLAKAVHAGFRDFARMAEDTDLDTIRSDPRFETITGGKARKAPPAAQ